jgi:hypothetical protein
MNRSSAWLWTFSALFSSIVCLPFFILALYNHPSADDYPCTIFVLESSPLTSVIGWYKIWSSRYTSYSFMALNPLVYRYLLGYQLSTWILISGIFGGFLFFSKAFFHLSKTWIYICLSVLFTFSFLSAVPSVMEAVYYFGGAWFYQPPGIFILLLTGILFQTKPLQSFKDFSFRNLIIIGIQILLIFLIAGGNEMVMGFNMALIGSIWLYHFAENRKPSFHFSILLISAIAFGLVVVLAPGLKIRMEASQGVNISLWQALEKSILAWPQFLVENIAKSALSFFLLALLFIPVSTRVPILSKKNLLFLGGLSIIMSVLCFLPSFKGEGMVQDRTANGILFIFLFLLILNIGFWKRKYQTSGYSPSISPAPFLIAATAVFLVFSPNVQTAWSDLLSGNAKAYDSERLERILLLETSPGDSLWLKPLRHKPKTLFNNDIGGFSTPGYDSYYARYHGKKVILLKNSGEKPRG